MSANIAQFVPTAPEYLRFLPEIILTVMATLLMVAEPLSPPGRKSFFAPVTFVSLAVAVWASLVAQANAGFAFSNMLVVDGFTTFFRVIVLAVGLLTVLCASSYLKRENAQSGEFYALLLFSVIGQSVMVSANELIMIFIGLEISSIASYVLAGYLRDDQRNNESALKYFLLGSFATAFLLYGVAWIYGLTGTTDLTEIRRVLAARESAPSQGFVSAAAALLFVGFAFKVSAVPFQAWAPDVYQGAPTPVAAFLSAGPKAAAFAIFLRVFLTAFPSVLAYWEPVMWVVALLTMVVGNFAALTQSNIKRMMAYSSIAHAGYVMVALTATTTPGSAGTATAAAMFYLAAYALMNVGAFAVISHVVRQGERFVAIDDLKGLSIRQPVTAALFTVFLASLIGVPLTGGFFGKFYIFKAALDSNLIWLTVLGLLNSAVAAYYYLRIIVVMYMHEPGESVADLTPVPAGVSWTLWVSAAGTLALGIFPSAVLEFATRSAGLLK